MIRWNIFNRRLIAVHGVAMNINQAKKFEALIWCPASNFFLLNKTAEINMLKNNTRVLFGTDSTLTANWNIWEQIRLARKTNLLSDKEIFDSLTQIPASVWNLKDRENLSEGKYADIVVAKQSRNANSLESFFELSPGDILLVIKDGNLVLVDETLFSMTNLNTEGYSKVFVNGIGKYIKGNLADLIKQINGYVQGLQTPVKLSKYESGEEIKRDNKKNN